MTGLMMFGDDGVACEGDACLVPTPDAADGRAGSPTPQVTSDPDASHEAD